jgi:hypothetical protein
LTIWHSTFLLVIIYVLRTQMGHASPFKTFMFQEIFNDIMNFSIQWILTSIITFWRFRSPLKFQFPKWKLISEYGGSFSHTLLHSQEHEMWFLSSFLARTFARSYLGDEPKVKVATSNVFEIYSIPTTTMLYTTNTNISLVATIVIMLQMYKTWQLEVNPSHVLL